MKKTQILFLMLVFVFSILSYAHNSYSMVDETAIQEIILQVLPQPAYVATLQDKTRYKYDILISNKSSSDMTISGLDIEFFNNNGPIDGLNKYYYGVLLNEILDNQAFYILSCNNIDDGVTIDDFLYFSLPGIFNKDTIGWTQFHRLPDNSLLLMLFPQEEITTAYPDVTRINIAVHGMTAVGSPVELTADIVPVPFITPREYKLPVKGKWYISRNRQVFTEAARRSCPQRGYYPSTSLRVNAELLSKHYA